MEKIGKFNKFIKEGEKIVKESRAKKDWTVGDVQKVEKQLKLVIKNHKSLHNNKEKLQKLLDSFSNHKQGDKMIQANKLSFQENPEAFLAVLKQMFPDVIK